MSNYETEESLVRKSKSKFEKRQKSKEKKFDDKAKDTHKLGRFFKECQER